MKYLGVDFGLKRVGLSISFGEIASAWKIIAGKSIEDLAKEVGRLAKDEKVDQLVVGMPEGKIARAVKNVVILLKKQGLSVVEEDETLSSQNAQKLLIEQNVPKMKRRLIDAHAAALILQNYLDRQKKK